MTIGTACHNELHLSLQPDLRGGPTGMSLQPTERPG
jgi:hypothetical protein